MDSSNQNLPFRDRLALPLIAAPMFLVSGIELVVAASRSGVIGSFPTANCRSADELDQWLAAISDRLHPTASRPADNMRRSVQI